MKVVSFMQVLIHIAILYGFYRLGVWIQQALSLSIPGSIIGMLLLFLLLVTKIIPVTRIEKGTTFLIRHMPLLFIPVTVGVMDYFDVFRGKGSLLIVITLLSTILVFGIAGLVSQWCIHKMENKRLQPNRKEYSNE
ncbi:CidA/LrgA family protein [Alkalihalophilus marmarensis]|uniref:CidA/LrgA family protein n=1 Tax=Alkalihalophilus marmarensis TaxID=521377 RepID=UPI002DBBA729|nr:CidA/LrgA family protein [Alkalihalophilus marmarensis]MEC2071801.1 CidA/LrgA family protein [Alkalihalophilus marmarensis]